MNIILIFLILSILPIIMISKYTDDYRNYKNIKKMENVPDSESFGLDKIKFIQGIPKIIYRTHKDKNIIRNFQEEFNITSKNCPGYKTEFYTNEECDKFVKDNFSERIYNAYSNINVEYGACKADLFRYLIVYLKGGIYLDIKSVVVKNIDSILKKYPDKLIVHHPWIIPYVNAFSYSFPPWGEYNQWCIVAPKGHPILKKIIEKIVYNIELETNRRDKIFKGGLDVLTLTGPHMFTKVIKDNNNKGVKEIGFNFDGCFKKKKSLLTDYKSKYGKNTHYYKLSSNIIS